MDESIPRIHTPLRILPQAERDRRRPARRSSARDERAGVDSERAEDASLGQATPTEPGLRIDLSA